ncbi:MAG TPA: VOC family protein [Candidatus Krumholzibacteriaceae bacterium]|nr:VOC family protein [Candidatus Krumholzibacteriaceae bacterium]
MSEKVRGVITWLNYRDLPRATEFYENVMGFKIEKTSHEEAEEQKQRAIPEAAMN